MGEVTEDPTSIDSRRYCFVASTGGHLEELWLLAPLISPDPTSAHWITFDSPQSRSLLAGRLVDYVPYIPPRGAAQAMRVAPLIRRVYRQQGTTHIVSTGAAIALPALTVGTAMGLDSSYIESLARTDGPSLTGRMLAWNPRVRLLRQSIGWVGHRWEEGPNVLDHWRMESTGGVLPAAPTILVTLGTIKPYGFRRLIEAVLRAVPVTSEITWQTGATKTEGLGIEAKQTLTRPEMDAAIAAADVVIAHAGVGSALSVLSHGKCPILVPRRREYNEHVDDHQMQIATELAARGLAVVASPENLTGAHLATAFGRRIRRTTDVDISGWGYGRRSTNSPGPPDWASSGDIRSAG